MTATPHQREIRATVRAALKAGISIVPPKEDGTKAPFGAWKQFQKEQAPSEQFNAWYGPRTGVGFVCGAVSGGLELLELDADFYAEFKATAEGVGLGPLLARIEGGYLERTPGGGWHLLYRCSEVRGNTKLAQRPGPPDAKGRPTVDVLIETRGEGGYVVVAPSNGKVHKSGGKYQIVSGGPGTIAEITDAERDALWGLAKSFDQMPDEPVQVSPKGSAKGSQDDPRPGDDYNRTVSWPEVMAGHGWTHLYTRGDTAYWRRPGKTEGWSATTNHNGSGLLYVFSSSTAFEPGKSYTKFGAFAVLNHGGDHSLAARSLSTQGYGKPSRLHPTNKNSMVRDGKGWKGSLRDGKGAYGESAKGSLSIPKDVKAPNHPSEPVWGDLSDADLGMLDLSTVTPKQVQWLLKNRIPIGKFSMLAGEGGLGKTFAMLSIAAGVSTGSLCPGGGDERYPIGDVIILTAEDDPEDTIVPRLMAMGADLKRIVVLGTAKLPNGRMEPVKLGDIDRLQEVLRRRPETKLIFVDPMPSFLGRGVDDGKNAELRMILGPLAEFASEHSLAVLGITHFNKTANARAAQRVMGSVAYSNVARATWCLVEDPETEGRRLLLPVKNNLSPDRNNGLAFTIVDGAVVWENEAVTTPINEVLSGSTGANPAAKRGKAVEFLRELLTGKRLPSDEVIKKAKEKGFGKNLIWEVKPDADVKAVRDGFGGGGQWLWTIDAPEAPVADDVCKPGDWTTFP